MKYVSPTTEMRRQQMKKRKQQKVAAAVLVCIAIVVGLLAVKFLMPKKEAGSDKPVITQPEETPTIDEVPEETPNTEDTPEEQPEATPEATPETQPEATPKPTSKPAKKPWFSFKFPSFFSKTEKEGEAFPVTAFGRTIEQGATGIVSLSPTATEALLSMPVQDTLLAVTEYCNKRGNEKLMTVGTPLIPQIDKIIQIAPEYLIIQMPLTQSDKTKIEQSGIKILQFTAPKKIEDLKEIYRNICALVLGKTKADNASTNVMYDIETKLKMYELALQGAEKQKAMMIFSRYGNVATADTIESEFLKPFFNIANGGTNYFAGTLEELAATNPQVLILPNTFTETTIIDMGFGETDAVKNGKVYYVPIQDFENVSPKVIKHLADIASEVYQGQTRVVTIQEVYPEETKDKKSK